MGVLFCIGLGLAFIGAGAGMEDSRTLWSGVAVLLLGPLGVRIYCEILIIFFRINETLTEMKHLMEERRQGTS